MWYGYFGYVYILTTSYVYIPHYHNHHNDMTDHIYHNISTAHYHHTITISFINRNVVVGYSRYIFIFDWSPNCVVYSNNRRERVRVKYLYCIIYFAMSILNNLRHRQTSWSGLQWYIWWLIYLTISFNRRWIIIFWDIISTDRRTVSYIPI